MSLCLFFAFSFVFGHYKDFKIFAKEDETKYRGGFDLQWKSTKLFLLFLPTDLIICQCFQVLSS